MSPAHTPKGPDHRARQETYGEINNGHLVELLAEQERVVISRESLRGILRTIGVVTGKVVAASFRDQLDGIYLPILPGTIEAFGVPCAIYRDRHRR